MGIITYPFDSGEILRRRKSLKRQLLEQSAWLEKRVAILSGSTVGDVKDILELFLLHFGIKPKFYVGQYDRFYEDVMFDRQDLTEFDPDLIYIHTSVRNLLDTALMDKLQAVWGKIRADYSCAIIQNNFELPPYGMEVDGRHINALNVQLADYEKENSGFYVHDIQHLSACLSLDDWFNPQDYFLYKYAFSVKAIPVFCYSVSKIIKSIYGKNQKCLVLDLDNTLWGGVVGDVGVMGIELGMETASGEAYLAFQKYVKDLHDRGIILAVCSKNEERIAKEAFSNPNMVLRLEDIAVFRANWENKADNLLSIAEQLNILPESMVFVDDNPAERELIKQALPDIHVVEAGSVVDFIGHIEGAGYFYATGVSDDDKKRNAYYAADLKRNETKCSFADYGEYLSSLQMKSLIRSFDLLHLDRITQLINKTNQFNLTTHRFNQNEIEKIAADPVFITLYATLDDKFGSNGIVSVLIGEIIEGVLHIRLWVMSCRVFKRDLELAVFDRLVAICKKRQIEKMIGYYFKTEKNGYVAGLFDALGFSKITDDTWEFNLAVAYRVQNKHIQIEEDADKWIL